MEQKANELLAQVDAYRDLSSSLAVDETRIAPAEEWLRPYCSLLAVDHPLVGF